MFINVVTNMAYFHSRIVVAAALVGLLGAGRSASAQVPFGQSDLSGSWSPVLQEDSLIRFAGPTIVDYLGLPFNEEGRALALATAVSRHATIERQCQLWPQHYLSTGPFGMKIWNDLDPMSGMPVAWHIGAWEDRAETVIWMDGRPHPPAEAMHTRGGFWTGKWRGQTLTTTATHMKAGNLRRNGAQMSDQSTLTSHFIRHGDQMTVVMFVEDPVYLTEVMAVSTDYTLDSNGVTSAIGPPCVASFEGVAYDAVEHYLPGANPFVDDLTVYGIPRDAALGGAEGMYPEYRKKLKAAYVRPEKCVRNCGSARSGLAALLGSADEPLPPPGGGAPSGGRPPGAPPPGGVPPGGRGTPPPQGSPAPPTQR